MLADIGTAIYIKPSPEKNLSTAYFRIVRPMERPAGIANYAHCVERRI
jgi:hypothetical protein